MKNSKLFSCVILILLCFEAISQPVFLWGKQFEGPNDQRPKAIATDAAGNVYTTGDANGSSDFDPGPGVFNSTTVGNRLPFVSKLDGAGNFVWAIQLLAPAGSGGSSNDIKVDNYNNVYITGFYAGTIDFDPGAGTFNMTSVGSNDIFILKLDPSGNFVWAAGIGSTLSDQAESVTVDSLGNVYATGHFRATADFNPGTGVFNMTPTAGAWDVFVMKLDGSGNFVWAKQIGGTSSSSSELAYSIAVDTLENIYVVGNYTGSVDFNPALASFTLFASTVGSEIFVLKWTSAGNFIWAKRIGDGSTSSDAAFAVAVNLVGDIHIAGSFSSGVDFDPGTGVSSLLSSGLEDSFTCVWDTDGNFKWAKKLGGNDYDGGNGVAVDQVGNVYTTGFYTDPSTAISRGFTTKFDPLGNPILSAITTCTNRCTPYGIATDNTGDFFTTGEFEGTSDFDLGTGTFNMTAVMKDAFIVKHGCSIAPGMPSSISGPTTVCEGTEYTFTATLVPGAYTYTWTFPGMPPITNTYPSVTAIMGASSGNVTVTAENPCGTSTPQTLSITVNPMPVVSFVQTPNLVCDSDPQFTLSPGSPAGGTYSGEVVGGNQFNPGWAGVGIHDVIYSFTGTNGCVGAITQQIQVDVCTGIVETNTNSFEIYPNPTNGFFTIKMNDIPDDAVVKVLDLLGKVVLEQSASSTMSIDLSQYGKGIYMVMIVSEESVKARKVILQ